MYFKNNVSRYSQRLPIFLVVIWVIIPLVLLLIKNVVHNLWYAWGEGSE